MKDEIMVSICCITYNHEKYIRQALDSFLMQKTNFKYEIIIHDDASTDNTANIIREYEKKYPDIIKPIYQKENQYSKGESVFKITLQRCNGKYITLCEGDDYWIDENMLQKKVDFLESNHDYALCVNNAIKVQDKNKKNGHIAPVKFDKELTCEEFIAGGGNFVATNSIFAPRKYFKKLPSYLDNNTIDYLWQIYLSSCGKTYCFKDIMTAYRVNVKNSWTDKIKKNSNQIIKLNQILIKKLKQIDIELDNQYENVIKEEILELELQNIIINKEYNKLKIEPYKSYIKRLSTIQRVKNFFKIYFPEFFKIIKKIFKK